MPNAVLTRAKDTLFVRHAMRCHTPFKEGRHKTVVPLPGSSGLWEI